MAALLASPRRALVALDYDGTLSPIVDDPTEAYPEPRAVDGLVDLSEQVAMVAIITGRPAQLAVDLTGLADRTALDNVVVVGHYGMERWDARSGELQTAAADPGVASVRHDLPEVLASLDLSDADIEDKGLSVAVHVRRLDDADQAFEQMVEPLTRLAEGAGLVAEPGRQVVELRPTGMDKGRALSDLVREIGATVVVFVGDDLGDLAAFAEVERLRREGLAGLLVCSMSHEVTELAERADLVVDGPHGVSALLSDLVQMLDDQTV